MCDFYGSVRSHSLSTADGVQAYVQAYLKGPATWVEIPLDLWPKSWVSVYDRPVVPLRKALYGHPNAGAYWECECNDRLRTLGYRPFEQWPSCFYHEKLKLMLCVYVDGFKLSGPRNNLEKGWSLFRDDIKMDVPQPPIEAEEKAR